MLIDLIVLKIIDSELIVFALARLGYDEVKAVENISRFFEKMF